MRQFITILLVLFSFDTYSQQKELIYLWPGKVPGETKEKEKQKPSIDTIRKDGNLRYNEITNPAIEVWLPDPKINKGAGVIVCPGGSYRILSYNLEGTEIAAWLNKLGYAAFVLSYRVPDKQTGALQDAQRAIRIVRNNSSKWKINPDKVGIMGFSAGGSLSARASTLFNTRTYSPVEKADSLSCRPSFAMLIYPAYLDLGENKTLTPELKLSKETPPIFIFQSADDNYGNSSLVMAAALRNARLPFEMHMLAKGGHGYGMRPGNPSAETWPVLAEKWLSSILSQGQK
jgi:acetyl esterase/lipase